MHGHVDVRCGHISGDWPGVKSTGRCRGRHFILYYRMPYDRTMWAKYKDPVTIVVMYIAASPDVIVRGAFFTLLLACIIEDREEVLSHPR